jgi:hypothetical protein
MNATNRAELAAFLPFGIEKKRPGTYGPARVLMK